MDEERETRRHLPQIDQDWQPQDFSPQYALFWQDVIFKIELFIKRINCFGQCRGDYRSAHCSKCNKHYYAGYHASCYNCKSENESDDETGKREDWLFPYY